MIWLVLRITAPTRHIPRSPQWAPLMLPLAVYLMILSGGFVAGTDAGFSYPTWPLMGEHFFPPSLYADGVRSAFEQVTTIQFNHRMFAYLLAIVIPLVAVVNWRATDDSRVRVGSILMTGALAVQILLGISTLLTHVAIPIAAAHQGGAVLLLTAVLFFGHARLTERSRIR